MDLCPCHDKNPQAEACATQRSSVNRDTRSRGPSFAAVCCVEDTKVVASGAPARSTCAPLTNPLPFTVIANAPAGTDAGAMPASTGAGFWSVTELLPVALESAEMTARADTMFELGRVALVPEGGASARATSKNTGGTARSPVDFLSLCIGRHTNTVLQRRRLASVELCLDVRQGTTVPRDKLRVGTRGQVDQEVRGKILPDACGNGRRDR
jgi:hypothetical protein